MVYTSISGCKKSSMLKNNNLAKYQGKHTCFVDGYLEPYPKESNTSVTHNCQHLKYCKKRASCKSKMVAYQIQVGLHFDYKRKEVQFSILYEILNNGHLMIDYERSRSLLKFL